ncbi:putative helicase mov-10-B.1 isoform X1 [Vespa velutina]|uniref:putative helicase mov-10-B.1 isoform X1 n=2 Tax=Vespa velutina TaxID=202808 RepID=UPI001FB54CEE|nr:putative helicase mov-10-B.1 isoform X1 [Vespa velutina]
MTENLSIETQIIYNKKVISGYHNIIGQLPILKFLEVPKPKDLIIALKNNLKITDDNSLKVQNYTKCIESLTKINKIQQENYLFLFKILLYMEEFAKSTEITKNNLKCQKIQRLSNNIFNIFVPTLNIDDPFVKMEDKIVLVDSEGHSYNAQITKILNKVIYVEVPEKFVDNYVTDKKYDIRFIYSNWSMKCCHYALYLVNNYNLTSLMYPTFRTNTKYLKSDLNWLNKSVKENAEQKQAVINILSMTAYPAPYILFGPPGTGKTATLVELICQIWQQGTSKSVLVCASSNAAIDEITKRLLKYIPANEMHRMYPRCKKRSDVDPIIYPCTNFVNDTNIFLPKEILLLKKIILTTIISCTRKYCCRLFTANIKGSHFSFVIIDEASQSIEPETLIPFLLACIKDDENKGSLQAQIVIAGDPCQLGPSIQSKIAEPLLGISMLERLMEFPVYKQDKKNEYNPHYITKLIRNFRSHRSILHVPNEIFYNNELIACGGPEINAAIGWSMLPNKKFPLIFHASNGKEKRAENSSSVYNLQEISIAMKYLRLLLNKKFGTLKIKQNHIGIVAPFRQQQIKINMELKKRNWENINVGTVETYQGREKEIIILTTVRSRRFMHDGKQHIGFLSNKKRFNVAVTRAKCLLIVIGNPIVLQIDNCWKLLMEYCKQNNAYIDNSSTTADIFEK